MNAAVHNEYGSTQQWVPCAETACGKILFASQSSDSHDAPQKMQELLTSVRESGYVVVRSVYHALNF